MSAHTSSSLVKHGVSLADGVLEKLMAEAARLGRGKQLPTVRQLTDLYGVSQLTIRNAIRRMEEQGIVSSQVGRGTFVMKNIAVQGAAALRTVCILREDYPSRRNNELTQKLHRQLVEHGHRSLVVTYSDANHALDLLKSGKDADAYVLQTHDPAIPVSLLAFLRERTNAVFVASSRFMGVDVDVIGTDYYQSIKLALDHLAGMGHREIGFASGEPVAQIRPRLDAFRLQMDSRGLKITDEMVVIPQTQQGEWSTGKVRSSFDRLLARFDGKLPFTALLVWSQASAVGILEACEAAGISVPDDLSLLVVDNPDLDARHCDWLTMVGVTSDHYAEAIYTRIQRRLENPQLPYETLQEKPQLVERQSIRCMSA